MPAKRRDQRHEHPGRESRTGHAEAALRRVPALVPGQVAIAALVALGRRKEAEMAAERFRRSTPAVTHHIPAQFYRALYHDQGFVEAVVHALREAGLPELPPSLKDAAASTVRRADDGCD